MTVAERTPLPELHFTEGEPDLEPPEELALSELDEQAQLEEELDNEDLLEQDVDEEDLEAALDDLVHADDDPPDGDGALHLGGPRGEEAGTGRRAGVEEDDEDDAEAEEGLDHVLLTRLALLDGTAPPDSVADDGDLGLGPVLVRTRAQGPEVEPCGSDEFVCRTCFLVRNRAQLCDAGAGRCRDCCT